MTEYTNEVMEFLWIEMIEDVKSGKAYKKIGDIAVLHGESWHEQLQNLDTQIIWDLYCSIPEDMRTVDVISKMMYCAMEKYVKKYIIKHGTHPDIAIGTVCHALTQLQAESDRLFDDPKNWDEAFQRADAIQANL